MCDKRPVECKTDPALCLDALVVWSPCINMGTFIEKLIIWQALQEEMIYENSIEGEGGEETVIKKWRQLTVLRCTTVI